MQKHESSMARKTHKHYAEEFGVSINTFAGWLRKGAPYQNEAKMKTWLLNLERKSPGVKKWLAERGAVVTGKKKKADAIKGAEELSSAESFRDHYRMKLDEAIQQNDTDSVKFWNEHYLKIDESIRKTELHAKKLGLEDGTTLARAEVERILRAVFYAGNACTQGVLTTACQQWADIHDPAELYQAIKPVIVGGRLFSGFSKVVTTDGAPKIPDWVMECAQQEAKQYLANSESLWTQ